MKNARRLYYVFIATVILAIIGSQFIIQYHLEEQERDANRIDLATHQAQLSEHLAGLVYYADNEIEREGSMATDILDSISQAAREWKANHGTLLTQAPGYRLNRELSSSVDSILVKNADHLDRIFNACQVIVNDPTHENVHAAIAVLEIDEPPYVRAMQQAVQILKEQSHVKMTDLKRAELVMSLSAVIILVLLFVFVVLPVFNRISASNSRLTTLSNELLISNQDLRRHEAEIAENLQYISNLQVDLKLSEQHFRELVENASDMIYELDPEGKFSYVNPIMERISEYDKTELQHWVYWKIIHPDDCERVVAFYRDQRRGQQAVTYLELRIVSRSGKAIWVGQNVRMFYEGNLVTRVRVIARDISGLVTAREALKDSELRFRTLAENAPVGIYQTDAHGRGTYVNRRWCEIAGTTEEMAIGSGWGETIAKDDYNRVRREWLKSVKQGGEFSMEFRFQHTDGEMRWVMSRATTYTDRTGRTLGYIGTINDITALKLARENAEQATRAKTQFLSMMSHEIRTPLNAINGLTHLLLEGNPRQDQQESLRLLKFSGENLLRIINDILDFNKIEAGKIDLEHIGFDIQRLVKDLVSVLEYRAKEKGIRLVLEIGETVPHFVLGDPLRIGQVINNLLSNAIKFTEEGAVTVTMNSGLSATGRSHRLSVEVRDTGIGIAPENLERIFEGFSQERLDIARKFGGTGLGLSISKRLLTLMGSDLLVESVLGEGSKFYFSLLLEEAQPSEEVQGKKQEKAVVNLERLEILLVEDNRVNQMVASNFLKKWNCDVDIAINGLEAVEMVKRKKYGIILMDLQMPGMDGYEATRHIRSMPDPYFKKVPIIALTASIMSDVKKEALEAGVNDFLGKPFSPEELSSRLSRYVGFKQVSSEPSRILGLNSLDVYAEGDAEFKREFAMLLSKNIVELEEALDASIAAGDDDAFRKACHKMKVTLNILGDQEYIDLIERIRQRVIAGTMRTAAFKKERTRFAELSRKIVADLREEIESLS